MDYEQNIFEEAIEKLGSEDFINLLSPLLTCSRKSKIDLVLQQRLSGIRLAIESPADIHNVFAAIRSTEALGVMHVDLINSHSTKKLAKNTTTSGAHRWVHLNSYSHFDPYQKSMKEKDTIIGGACHDGKLTLQELPLDKNVALIFGNEHLGLEAQTKRNCDFTFQIPMFGMVESYNLSVSCALALHYLCHRKRQHIKDLGNLSNDEKQQEKAWYYFKSLGVVEVQQVLKKALARALV
ncbi:MAG: hypothetical protein GWP59_05375 [Chlamydiales bacterium]|nr:hypothetical protein [Chlamydiales bacterium]